MRRLLLVLVLISVSTGCSLRGERVETGTPAGESEDIAAAFDASANATTLDDSAVTGQGSVVDAFSFTSTELFSRAPTRGQDLRDLGSLVMTFVSPTCEFSAADALEFADAAENNPDVAFVFVHTGGTTGDYEAWVERSDLFHENVRHLDDSDAILMNRFSVTSQPSSVLVDSAGLMSRTVGAMGHEGLLEVVGYVS